MIITYTKEEIMDILIKHTEKKYSTKEISCNWKDYNEPNGFEIEVEK